MHSLLTPLASFSPPQEIVAKLAFPAPPPTEWKAGDVPANEVLDSAEAAIFMGDFNYRLAMPADEVFAAIAAGAAPQRPPSGPPAAS